MPRLSGLVDAAEDIGVTILLVTGKFTPVNIAARYVQISIV